MKFKTLNIESGTSETEQHKKSRTTQENFRTLGDIGVKAAEDLPVGHRHTLQDASRIS